MKNLRSVVEKNLAANEMITIEAMIVEEKINGMIGELLNFSFIYIGVLANKTKSISRC